MHFIITFYFISGMYELFPEKEIFTSKKRTLQFSNVCFFHIPLLEHFLS